MNDEFAKKIGKETMDDARNEVRAQLLERKQYNDKVAMKNQIMEQLLKKHAFDLPETMVARQLKVLTEKAENELKQKGVDEKTMESHKAELKDQLTRESENKVKLYFILDAIANIEKVESTDEETEEWIRNLAVSYNQPFDKVKEYYRENDLIGGLEEQIREDKTLDFLLDEAEIVEKK